MQPTPKPNKTVDAAPPINPSHVFFGDSLIRGVFPKKNPNIYAIMSLQIIIETGVKNLENVSHSLVTVCCKMF